MFIKRFNSRTREGCDCRRAARHLDSPRFNSRTREGCDYNTPNHFGDANSFNSRTREGCDFLRSPKDLASALFQFTHPGGVRLRLFGYKLPILVVSIHAPGRGATCAVRADTALTRFQFTHPGGVRRAPAQCSHQRCSVSIHAPGRGATPKTCTDIVGRIERFNSRTREGCDFGDIAELGITTVCFNSRTREGCDSLHHS